MGPRIERTFLGRFPAGTEAAVVGTPVILAVLIHNRDRVGEIAAVGEGSITVKTSGGSTEYTGEIINQMQIEVPTLLRFTGITKRLRYTD